MRDKDITKIADILFKKYSKLILTCSLNPRSMSADELLKLVRKGCPRDNAIVTTGVAEAIEKAKELVGENGIILVTGSLYLVGEVKKILNN